VTTPERIVNPKNLSADALLIITGSMGSGKTTVMFEAADLLAARNIPHAAIDLDALGTAHLPTRVQDHGLMYLNLRSVWENYAEAGLKRLLLARAIESREELECCQKAVKAQSVAVCRLTATIQTMEGRVQRREKGALQNSFVARVAELNAILDRARLEDFVLSNENRSVTDTALEMLARSGWL
jgi:predicted kinase